MNDDGSSGSDEPGLGLPLPEAQPGVATPYRVLARKYRPSSFADLIGQEPMVRTLTNAFALDRIHQAYLLTGVRGVGKTTTARILARAFNYARPAADGLPAIDRPTIDMQTLGTHCEAIIESRHVDVIEMDAASHTGVDDVREIIDGTRYRPVMARTKIFIIDEVHMLSKAAFNALLKTLEEPPDHVRFLFATTEIDKVPVTVRSRCQRFDLRRVEADVLVRHLATICAAEKVDVDEEALALVARAAEGSVRDALSLLDQAIAIGGAGGSVDAVAVRAMLGLADRSRIIDLFEAVMKGSIATALEELRSQYDSGADPVAILTDLAAFVHFVTRLKIAPAGRVDVSITEAERKRGTAFAETLSLSVLTRAWQLLSKGLKDVRESPRPLAAADMVLVRLAYAADLPTPDDVLRRLQAPDGGGAPAPRSLPSAPRGGPVALAMPAGSPAPAPAKPAVQSAPQPQTFADIVALAAQHRDIQLKTALERDMRLVRFEPGSIDVALLPGASPQLVQTLSRRLTEWTGARWMVALSAQAGAPTLREQELQRAEERMSGVAADPLVQSVLQRFPGAAIVGVRSALAEPEPVVVVPDRARDDEIAYTDDLVDPSDDTDQEA